ncbi:MAG: hypothetical protein ACKVU0_02040 [Saprospiraceae bacterium]
MRPLHTFFFFCAFLPFAPAQMHDNYWMFGYNYDAPTNNNGTLLHFEHGYPEFKGENVKHDFGLYCILCSDSTGNLLFHTNGRQIRNRLHNIMEGGDTINPGLIWFDYPNDYPSPTSGLSIPAPGLPNHYYLIHTSGSYSVSTPFPILYYSLIDMSPNGGLGKVVAKNIVIAEGDLPSPVAVKHGNGRDWWLIAGDMLSKMYKIFLIDPAGFHLVHEQNIAPLSFLDYGYCKASPDGTIFVSNDGYTGLWIFDFDRCNGLLSHPRVLPYQPPVFWTSTNAFSPDGRFFYAGTHLVVYQLDMQTIDSSYISLDTIGRYEYGTSPDPPYYTHFSLPELAPDDKIYYGTFNNSTAYHVINRPALPLLASDMAQRGLILPEHNGDTRCYFPNYRLGKWVGSPCDTIGFSSPPGSGFKDVPWSEKRRAESTEEIKVLKLPLGFHIPAPDGQPSEEDCNPLNMKTLMRKEQERRRHKASPNTQQQEPKHD